LRQNKTKAKLKSGETVFGCFVRYCDAGLVEVLGYCGWDFIVIDAEHGTIEPRDCENLARAAELRDITPIVRVTTNLPPIILRYLDTGAQGAHIPLISSPADAEAAVRSVKYQPRGARGLAGVRAAGYGQEQPFKDYVAQANAETLVVVQIETAEGVERLPEILEVKDLDVIFIGPTDLTNSLGVPGEVQHPKVQKTLERIVEMVRGSDKALGIMVSNAQGAQQWQERGARYIAIGLEPLLASACRSYLQTARARM